MHESLKKLKIYVLLISVLISLPLTSGISINSDLSEVIYVDDDNINGPWDGTEQYPFQEIQDALDAAEDGDTVFVFSGVYVGNIIIEKSVHLLGEDKYDTIIKNGKHNIWIYADGVSLSNFSIVNSSRYFSGVFIVSDDNIIENNLIFDNYDGILMDNTNNNILRNNVIFDNWDRNIRIEFSEDLEISSNYVGKSNYGIYLWSSSNNVIFNNVVDHCGWGISIGDSSKSNLIYRNTLFCNENGNGFDEIGNNYWDYGIEQGGNFWSDYLGSDVDGDGIGDVSYAISDEAFDHFPLMSPSNIDKPVVNIKSGMGFSLELSNEHDMVLNGVLQVSITNFQGRIKEEFDHSIILLSPTEQDIISKQIIGFGLYTVTVEFGMWVWEQDVLVFGPLWITL
jgi:parallel beta-helix repeat protein